jgi:hypothetical protein
MEITRAIAEKVRDTVAVCSVVGALLKKGAIERTGDCDVHVDAHGHVTKRERLRIRRGG